MLELKNILNNDCITVTGKAMGENLKAFLKASRREVIRSFEKPFADNGGVAVLYGNLAPSGQS